MDKDESLDLIGIGKLAEAIPDEAWIEFVNTACETFKQCIAPITSLTSGIGRLIEAKFDGLVDVQKILAAENIAKTKRKIEQSNQQVKGNYKAPIILKAIEESSEQTDETLRELWSNLLAQELIDGDVHPEIPNVLARLSSKDAQVLAQIAENSSKVTLTRIAKKVLTSFKFGLITIDIGNLLRERSFNHEHLSNLNLIEFAGGVWSLTLTGEAFIQALRDPSLGEPEQAVDDVKKIDG